LCSYYSQHTNTHTHTCAHQIAMSIDSFQLDNQMLETLRPVVISPTDVSNGANQMGRRCEVRICQLIQASPLSNASDARFDS